MVAQNQLLVPQQAPSSALSHPHPPLVEEEALALEEVAVEADFGPNIDTLLIQVTKNIT